MYRRSTTVVTGLIIALVFLCVLAVGIHQAAAGDGPRIRMSEDRFEFGFIPYGLRATHRYWLVNVGTDTLDVIRVRPTCGCTTVPLPTNAVSPGDSVPLDLVFDTQKFKGKVDKGARIYSNEIIEGDTVATEPRKIYFSAFVGDSGSPVSITPRAAFLDTIGKESQELVLVNDSPAKYKVTLSSPPPYFMSLDLATSEIPPSGRITAVLKEGEDTPLGPYNSSMTFLFEGPRTFSITVPIYGMGYYR